MQARKRLSRQESKEATRERLIEAAEKIFVRKGFDDASVEEISEAAGFSRGAFYSNFEDKDEIFLALMDRRPQAMSAQADSFRRISDPAERATAVREWISSQWQQRDFIALRMEFSRRAARNRRARKHLADFWRREVAAYASFIAQYCAASDITPTDRHESIVLALLAVVFGLGVVAIDTHPEMEKLCTEAARLAVDRLSAPEISHIG